MGSSCLTARDRNLIRTRAGKVSAEPHQDLEKTLHSMHREWPQRKAKRVQRRHFFPLLPPGTDS